jgi:cysteine synthase A
MPESMSIERRTLLKALGAQLHLTPASGGMKTAIEQAEQLVSEHPGSFMPQQFKNPANPEMHRKTTAQEILRDTEGNLDIFIAGIGTGGTITGVGEVLKEHDASISVVAVEPEESSVLSGESPGPHKIQGIGAGFVPDVLNTSIYDEIIRIPSQEAAEVTRSVAQKDGIFVGISSGAALAAARRIAQRFSGEHKRIVVILPDTGERYLSTWIFQES